MASLLRVGVFTGLIGGVGFGVQQFFAGRFEVKEHEYAVVVRNNILKPSAYGPGHHHCLPVLGERVITIDASPVECHAHLDAPVGPIKAGVDVSFTASLSKTGVVPLAKALGPAVEDREVAADAVSRAAVDQIGYATLSVATNAPSSDREPQALPDLAPRPGLRSLTRRQQGDLSAALGERVGQEAAQNASVEDQVVVAKMTAAFARAVEHAANPSSSIVNIADLKVKFS